MKSRLIVLLFQTNPSELLGDMWVPEVVLAGVRWLTWSLWSTLTRQPWRFMTSDTRDGQGEEPSSWLEEKVVVLWLQIPNWSTGGCHDEAALTSKLKCSFFNYSS